MYYKSMMTAALAGTVFMASAGELAHWSYDGQDGPTHWGELAPEFATCAAGKNQSPVNISGAIDSDLTEIKLDYKPGGYEVINNGHTIQVNYQPGSHIALDGHEYELKQFHFHSPSENLIESRQYPMEVHFVHADKDGNLAVVAVMFESGAENKTLSHVWNKMPHAVGEKQSLALLASAGELIPAEKTYFRFNGSLTTPPCSEGVTWLVMDHTDDASAEQLNAFLHTMHHSNNRPVQPLNARIIVR